MNKTALKTFATNARTELLTKVKAQALKIGITKEKIDKASIESSDAVYIGDRQLSKKERIQRDRLVDRIKQNGFDQVMDEVAYKWFNRFTALKFMEVNNHLPTKVRVLSSSLPDTTEPDIIREALSLDLDIDEEQIYKWKENNQTSELFKYLIIKHCNDLNRFMPFMFEKIDDYTEILFPEGLLKDSFVQQMTNKDLIFEDDWKQVEIIGWLYQFYIADEKERVFKQKKKYSAEEIPYATQLFTPNWIVRYMVQNSLGRYWTELHPEHRDLIEAWELYIENPEQEQEMAEKLSPYINKQLNVEDIKCFDPAMGSGHILVYMFDVLHLIYSKCGYMEREIPRLIIENNLYGLDVDDRAYQLACFSVVMKAMQYNKRFFRSVDKDGLSLNLASIQETNIFQDDDIAYIAGESKGNGFKDTKEFIKQFKDAKTIGSLLKINKYNHTILIKKLEQLKKNPSENLFEEEKRKRVLLLLPDLLKQADIMSGSYDILVTNPPYMGGGNMPKVLSDFVKKYYFDSKADLFSCFMDIDHYLKRNAIYASINQHSWMFLSSFEKLREKTIQNKTISSMLHLGTRTFEEIGGEVVQSTAFVLRNTYLSNIKGSYIRLVDVKTAKEKKEKTLEAVNNISVFYFYTFGQENFKKIPKSPIAYWITQNDLSVFEKGNLLKNLANPKAGLATGNNNLFQRLWSEVDFNKIGWNYNDISETKENNHRWFPCNSGGNYRKWSTNDEYVVDWENDGKKIKEFRNENGKLAGRPQNTKYYFKRGLTWNKLSNANFSVKLKREGFIFDDTSRSAFVEESEQLYYLIGFLCSKVCFEYLRMLNPTMSFTNGDLERIPIIHSSIHKQNIIENVNKCIDISKTDWDSYETSWDFNIHPLIKNKSNNLKLESSFKNWNAFSIQQFSKLKANEEELNKLFIEIYGLEEELTLEVEERNVTIRKAELDKDLKSFISYAIGCMFGRYSLDEEGLIYAGGEFDHSRYQIFPADENNILSILPGSYFEDDIVARFIEFVRVTFGGENLNQNLDFIADTIGKKKGETAKEALRRYFLNDFFKNHVQVYKKRPIYWLFTSGKQKAFNCLIYMHRYDKSTLSRIRTDYLHEYQNRLDVEKKDLMNVIESDASAKDISKAKKELQTLEKKIDELKAYDEQLHYMADQQIEIDLDDGVAVNYQKFEGLVAKI